MCGIAASPSGYFIIRKVCYNKTMNKRICVAMSGGVDSSVAAALLKKDGYEVIGVTMRLHSAAANNVNAASCGSSGAEEAGRVAEELGIRHHLIDLESDFSRRVVGNFCREYILGRTPNPCVRCNQFIKFGILLRKALDLGAVLLATGHYARVARSAQGYLLKKGRDRKKDQSYFLYRLGQRQLARVIFPLGSYSKAQVRYIAGELGLEVAQKRDSQEVCFLPPGGYGGFIKGAGFGPIKPGVLSDEKGSVIGRHMGIPFYTIGQRQGLGVAMGYPLYVTRIEARSNRIVLGSRRDACKRECLVKDIHFLGAGFKKKVEINVKIRYNHKESLAAVYPVKSKLKIRFKKPQFAITPGQSAVFYKGDTVLGGGIIEKVLD
jgi:tRNA-specific 2-thiouridylase